MRVLYASNGGQPARAAAALFRRLADAQRVRVTVNVCDSVEFAFPQEPWSYGGERRPRPSPKDLGAGEVADFRAEGFDADWQLGSGVPAEQILEQVEAAGYDLTVMGAGSSRWLDNFLLGSTSTKVLHASPTSVLIVHRFGPALDKMLRALVATDGSSDAGQAIETFLRLADPRKVSVKVVSVAGTVPKVRRMLPDGLPASKVSGYLESAAEAIAERAAEQLLNTGFNVEIECPTGDPVREILRLAGDADLVIVGSRGLGGAGRFILGSVSDQVARLAPAALVCRKPHLVTE